MISKSGLRLKDEYSEFDALKIFEYDEIIVNEKNECIAGEVLQGIKKPPECSSFGYKCTPEHPLGAPMVSAEGACAAYFRYKKSK